MSKGIIVIDAGHGERGNPHAFGEFFEGTQNFKLACFLSDALRERGFETMLTRQELYEEPTLAERGSLAGRVGARLFISLHSNAPSNDTPREHYNSIRGAETYYSLSDAENNAPIARALNDAVIAVTGTDDRGIKTRQYPEREGIDYYGVLRASVESGCTAAFLVEHGFHTNQLDCAYLQDDTALSRIAAAEADAIDRALSAN